MVKKRKGSALTGDAASGGTLTAIMKTASFDGWQGEMTGLRKDGSRFYTQVDAQPVKDARGTTRMASVVTRDPPE